MVVALTLIVGVVFILAILGSAPSEVEERRREAEKYRDYFR